MPMRAPRRPKYNQPGLFTPPPEQPTWATLSPEVQAKALALIARLLRAAHDRRLVAASDKEAGRE
jgi:hypothetical protein